MVEMNGGIGSVQASAIDDMHLSTLYMLQEDMQDSLFTITREQLSLIEKELSLDPSGRTSPFSVEQAEEFIRGN